MTISYLLVWFLSSVFLMEFVSSPSNHKQTTTMHEVPCLDSRGSYAYANFQQKFFSKSLCCFCGNCEEATLWFHQYLAWFISKWHLGEIHYSNNMLFHGLGREPIFCYFQFSFKWNSKYEPHLSINISSRERQFTEPPY